MSWAWLVLAIGVGVQHAAPASAQAPTPPEATSREIPRLTNFGGFAGLMNLARGTVRIVVVISPTCATRNDDVDAVARILRDNPSKRLRAYVVLVRASETDTQLAATLLAARQTDRRIVYLWDEAGDVLEAYNSTLATGDNPLHSRYFLYDTAAVFATAPPTAVLSLKNDRASGSSPLDTSALQKRADTMVRDVEARAAGANNAP